MSKRVDLNWEQLEYIKRDLQEHSNGHFDGCLCGYYEFRIAGVGYITNRVYCRKSSGCPDGMSWFVEDNVSIWSGSMCNLGYAPEREEEWTEEGIELIGKLNKWSAKQVKEMIRDDIIANHTWNNTDEYGNKVEYYTEYIDDEVGKSDEEYNYQKAYEYLLGCIVNLEASCGNCGSNEACCEDCKNGKQMWSFNHELLDGIDRFRV